MLLRAGGWCLLPGGAGEARGTSHRGEREEHAQHIPPAGDARYLPSIQTWCPAHREPAEPAGSTLGRDSPSFSAAAARKGRGVQKRLAACILPPAEPATGFPLDDTNYPWPITRSGCARVRVRVHFHATKHIWFSLSLTDWRSESSLFPGENGWVSPDIFQAQRVVSVTCPLLKSVGAARGSGSTWPQNSLRKRGP